MRADSSYTPADSYRMFFDTQHSLKVCFSFITDRTFQYISVSQVLLEVFISGQKCSYKTFLIKMLILGNYSSFSRILCTLFQKTWVWPMWPQQLTSLPPSPLPRGAHMESFALTEFIKCFPTLSSPTHVFLLGSS